MNILHSIARRLGSKGEPAFEPPPRPLTDREAVFGNPGRYTRSTRRSVGYLKPVWAEAMRERGPIMPRFARRHASVALSNSRTRRTRRAQARVRRSFLRLGVEVAS